MRSKTMLDIFKVAGDACEQGSVLMEFLIVAPLFLLLLGGLLLSNDMLRLKNKILMLDEFVTVVNTHRTMQGNRDAAKSRVDKTWGTFAPDSVYVSNILADEYEGDDGNGSSNNWNTLYAGRIDAEYRLPTTINSLLSVQRIVFGDENYSAPPQTFRFYADPKTGFFPNNKECRFHVVQRHWTPGQGNRDYDRIAQASELVCDDIAENIAQDSWLLLGNGSEVGRFSGNNRGHKQQLGEYAE